MTEHQQDLDRLLAELKEKEERRLATEQQARADAAETATTEILPSAWARQFVAEFADQCAWLQPRLGPELGRPIAMQVDPVMNPFHGTHHDYRTSVRVSQHELRVNACESTVRIDVSDLASGRSQPHTTFGSVDLTPSKRPAALEETLRSFLSKALGVN
jgi:hypothetical protein